MRAEEAEAIGRLIHDEQRHAARKRNSEGSLRDAITPDRVDVRARSRAV